MRTYERLNSFMIRNSASYKRMNAIFAQQAPNFPEVLKTVETVFRATQERMIRVGNNMYINPEGSYFQLSEQPLVMPDIVYVGNKFETSRFGFINLYLEAGIEEKGYPLLGSNEDEEFLNKIDSII